MDKLSRMSLTRVFLLCAEKPCCDMKYSQSFFVMPKNSTQEGLVTKRSREIAAGKAIEM